MMMTNQLTDAQRADFRLLGQKPFAVGLGFGLGVSVVLETDKADLRRRGSVGTVSWPAHTGDGGKQIPPGTSAAWPDALVVWLKEAQLD